MLSHEITQKTLSDAIQAYKSTLEMPESKKAVTTATGLTGITLESPAKSLVPFLSPFRQKIPRTTQPGSTGPQWKSITAVNFPKFSALESVAARQHTLTVTPRTTTFKEVGLGDSVTRKAVAEAQGFDDVKARAVNTVLLNSMRLEEIAILGGNITALATPGAPVVTVVDGGGTVPAAAAGYDVRIAALTLFGANRVTIDRPAALGSGTAPLGATDAPLAGNGHGGAAVDPESDGVTVAGTLTTSAAAAGNNDALRITWAPVNGAAAYAVYVIANGGTPKLEAIVTQCNVTLTSLAGTGALSTALTGTSADSAIFNGIIPLIFADANAYVKNLAGKLNGTGGEITEIQDAFASVWDKAKIGEFDILVGGFDQRTLNRLSIAAGGGPTIFVDPAGPNRLDLMQGYHVGSIVNGTTGDKCNVQTLPWLPSGMIIGLPTKIPYPNAEIQTPFELAASYGWVQIDYATSKADGPVANFEVREDAVLKDYFTLGCFLIHNINFA